MTLSDNISKKVARLIGLSESTIVRLVQKNIFPLPYRLEGGHFSRQEVKQWEQDQKLKRGFALIRSRKNTCCLLNVNKAQ